jgi:hypothetical protein
MSVGVWEITEAALGGLNLPAAASFYQAPSGGSLPDAFLVYFLVSSLPELHGDNAELLRTWRMQVNYYSRRGLGNPPNIDGAMTAAGFTRGPQRELPYNELTRHFGLALEYTWLDDSQEESA